MKERKTMGRIFEPAKLAVFKDSCTSAIPVCEDSASDDWTSTTCAVQRFRYGDQNDDELS